MLVNAPPSGNGKATPATHADGTTRVEVASLHLADEAATRRLGADLALALGVGDIVALSGDLGAGKSTLARALIRTLADDAGLDVPSPTYTLVQAYETTPPVAHFDLYRIGSDGELDELGFDDAAETGIVLAEWPQNAPAVLKAANVVVELGMAAQGAGRFAAISASGPAAARIERSLAIRGFLQAARHGEAVRRRFTGDASTRRYETIHALHGLAPDGLAPDGHTLAGDTINDETAPPLVLMDAPRQPDGPPVRDGLPYSRIAHLAEDVVPFVAVAEALSGAGFAAPSILSADLDGGLLLITHLGNETMLDDEGQPVPARYEAAIACLADLHATPWTTALRVPNGLTHHLASYDRRVLAMEVDLVPDWYLPREKGRPASADERALFTEIWAAVFDELQQAETSLTLRDFHSPNIIWRPQEQGRRRIGLIDFQDAVMGPSAYDVASLAQDARVDISAELEARLVSAYIAMRRKADPGYDAFGFERDYAIMSVQRNSKILGIFVRLLERDGKPQYLRHIPRIKRYLVRSLGHPSLSALKSLYEDWGIIEVVPAKRPS